MLVNNVEELQPQGSVEIKKSFLYVGNLLRKSKKCQSLLYKESFVLKDLQTAKVFLSNCVTMKEYIPDLIILDIPYSKHKLADFLEWIKDRFIRIPVIYNQTAIPFDQIKELKKLNLIDDVVKIENYCKGLHEI